MYPRVFSSALLVVASALASHGIHASRDPSCDDQSDLSSGCAFIVPDSGLAYCPDAEILSIQRGCFVCVNPFNCLTSTHQELPETLMMFPPAVDATEGVALSSIRDEHAEENVITIYPKQAAAQAAAVSPSQHQSQPAMQEVSNWYFLVPAFLALVSVGIALRGRMERMDIEFERVDGEDNEEINPFCAVTGCNPQHDDSDLEYGKPVDSDDKEEDDKEEDDKSHRQE